MQTPNDVAYQIALKHKDSLRWQKPRKWSSLNTVALLAGGTLLALMVLVVRLLRD